MNVHFTVVIRHRRFLVSGNDPVFIAIGVIEILTLYITVNYFYIFLVSWKYERIFHRSDSSQMIRCFA